MGLLPWLLLPWLAWTTACSTRPAGSSGDGAARVPAAHQGLYAELDAKLADLEGRLSRAWDGQKGPAAIGMELLVANANRGEVLLRPQTLSAVKLTLDRIKELGARSVALSLPYPLLAEGFPRSAEYLEFYRRVSEEARQGGFVVVAEMGSFFQESEFTQVAFSYEGLTQEQFTAGLREMAGKIVSVVKPHYLTILSEPDTMARNTGLAFPPDTFARTIGDVIDGLPHEGVLLGAGGGTWNPLSYFSALAGVAGLDYLDMHIYPIHRDFALDRVAQIADIARSAGKKLSIGEAWLYKVSQDELGKYDPARFFARDAYSFWAPLDERFVELIVGLSHHYKLEFASFFWMRYFYGYIPWQDGSAAMTPQQVLEAANRAAAPRIASGQPSGTGLRFQSLLTRDAGRGPKTPSH